MYSTHTEKGIGCIIAIQLFVWLFSIVAWCGNLYHFCHCDFNSKGSWKGEVLHGAGLATPVCWVTAWKNWDTPE